VNQQLPGLIQAFYIEGSIALGEFNERLSDIDFVAVLKRSAASAEIECLRDIHTLIEKTYPRWKMSGRYLQFDRLGRLDDRVERILYFHDGRLRLDGHFELNSVEGWILKNHGVVLIGPEPHELPFTIDWELLINKMRENLNTYWVRWTRRPSCLITMLSDWGIQWTVLGVLRQFYSFRENSITTKTKAGEYALTCVPTCWRRLIQEAINIRAGKKPSAYRFRVVRMVEAVNFLKYIIQSCNADFS
jgi:hypothetical protein